jgi:hypothetical protein
MLKFREEFGQNLSLVALGIAQIKWLLLGGFGVFLRIKISSNARPGYFAHCNT